MSNRKQQVASILKQVLIAIGIAVLFSFLGIFPSLGYHGEVNTQVVERDPWGFWIVNAEYNISLNPVLYPFSWLSGTGSYSSHFRFVSVPTYAGYEFKFPVWRNTAELNEEAVIIVLVNHIMMNFIPNLFMLLAIGLLRKQPLYVFLLGGLLGFAVGSAVGSLVGAFGAVLIVYSVAPRVRPLRLAGEYLKSLIRDIRN